MFRQKSRKCSIQSGLFLLCILLLFPQTAIAISERLSGASTDSELVVSPISKSYLRPPGIMPIVVLQGEPYSGGVVGVEKAPVFTPGMNRTPPLRYKSIYTIIA